MMLDMSYFHEELPERPMGRYAHIITLRETEGYALFQTDGELNRAEVSAGREDSALMTRLTLFKRKQVTPERLVGRELLRRFGLISDVCDYNVKSCRACPDCVIFGFAVGDGGSEKSKVYTDSAFSITDYRSSHEMFTLNAPYEDGSMSRQGEASSRINQADHVKPQVFFPSVTTTRDLTANAFLYVLSSHLRTERYGATTTRGGTVKNHVIGIALSDGEIFSNLRFTQALFDVLVRRGVDFSSNVTLLFNDVFAAASEVIPNLLATDNTREHQLLMGADLQNFLDSMVGMSQEEFVGVLSGAADDSALYAKKYIAKPEKK